MLFWITFAIVAAVAALLLLWMAVLGAAFGGEPRLAPGEIGMIAAVAIGLGFIAALIVTGAWTLLAPIFS